MSGTEGGAELQGPDRWGPPRRAQHTGSPQQDGLQRGRASAWGPCCSPGAQGPEGPQHRCPRHALHTQAQCSWIQCCGATSCSTQFNYLSTCQAFLKKIYNFIVTINKVTLHLFLTYSWTNPKSTQPPLPLLWNLHYLVPTTSQKLPFKIKAEMKIKQKSYYLFFNVNYYCIVIFILLFYFKH